MSDDTIRQRPRRHHSSRRAFITKAIAAGAAASASQELSRGARAQAQTAPGIRGFDHVAIPIQNVEAMIAFYRSLGLEVKESGPRVSVHFGDQKINFHVPAVWQRASFTLRAPAARPPCGDICWVWEGGLQALRAMLDRAGAKIIEGPGPRDGARAGGTLSAQSLYIRDPDGNLLEFMMYS
jgi:catechol 2,3-dioxygenase-like lactoylglutathione lyase family enzyme